MPPLSTLDSLTLVLNRHYAAIHVITVRRAFALLLKGTAEVVDASNGSFRNFDLQDWMTYSVSPLENGAEWVRTVRQQILAPRVIRLDHCHLPPRPRVRLNRRSIMVRDGYRCQYCGRRYPYRHLTIDHVVPRSAGGLDTWTNLVTACAGCNDRKGGHTPPQVGMHLLRPPRTPAVDPLFALSTTNARYRSWAPFTAARA